MFTNLMDDLVGTFDLGMSLFKSGLSRSCIFSGA